jgi:hypothetical protein
VIPDVDVWLSGWVAVGGEVSSALVRDVTRLRDSMLASV